MVLSKEGNVRLGSGSSGLLSDLDCQICHGGGCQRLASMEKVDKHGLGA